MESYTLFDTHAHYDHQLFADQGPEIIRKLHTEKVIDGVVIPAISFESNYNRRLFPADEFPYVYFAAGLHPKCATNEEWWQTSKKQEFEKIVCDPRTVAIKTGLDFCKAKLTDAQKSHQIRFFKYMINIANEYKLPLVLHIRDAISETIEVLSEEKINTEAVAHCFTYGINDAEALMNNGVTRFGIGGMLTRDEMAGLRACVKELPVSSILIETDAPFVKPKWYEGSFNTSETMADIVRLIADIKGFPEETLVEVVQRNAVEFYGLDH